MDEDGMDEEFDDMTPPAYAWTEYDAIADALMFATNIAQVNTAHLETLALRARARANYHDQQKEMEAQASREIETLTEPKEGP